MWYTDSLSQFCSARGQRSHRSSGPQHAPRCTMGGGSTHASRSELVPRGAGARGGRQQVHRPAFWTRRIASPKDSSGCLGMCTRRAAVYRRVHGVLLILLSQHRSSRPPIRVGCVRLPQVQIRCSAQHLINAFRSESYDFHVLIFQLICPIDPVLMCLHLARRFRVLKVRRMGCVATFNARFPSYAIREGDLICSVLHLFKIVTL